MEINYITYTKCKKEKYLRKYKCLFYNKKWLLNDTCLSKPGVKGFIAIAKQEDLIVGYCFVEKTGLIFNLFVFPPYRQMGIGKKLLHLCINIYKGKYLEVEKDNYLAISLYEKMHFYIKNQGFCYNEGGEKKASFTMEKKTIL